MLNQKHEQQNPKKKTFCLPQKNDNLKTKTASM